MEAWTWRRRACKAPDGSPTTQVRLRVVSVDSGAPMISELGMLSSSVLGEKYTYSIRRS